MAHNGTMDAVFAWAFLIVFWIAPLVHVALSPKAGTWRPPVGIRCPFGPRAGWFVIVLLLGAIGWLMFARARLRRPASAN